MSRWNKFDPVGLLFPRRCPVCHEVVEDPGEFACDICRTRLVRVRDPFCGKCGKPLAVEEQEYCGDCMRKKHAYDRGRAAFVYEEWMRRSIAQYKYGGRREYAEFYANAAVEKYGVWLNKIKAEVLIPIPMYSRKKRLRGYNQAEVFARDLGRKAGILVDEHLVRRVRNTIPQKELNESQRHRNLKNAFQLTADIVEYKRVVLVDDIYTTGSTMDEVSKVLKASGVENIYYICISIGEGY